MKCPTFERLMDYLDGRLAGGEADRVALHLASCCTGCADSRDWYGRLRAVTVADDSVEPPQWVLKRALKIFETVRGSPRPAERIGVGHYASCFR